MISYRSDMAFSRKKQRTRSPVKGSLRRLPGQSVRDERDRILNDQISEYLIGALAFCLLALWEWLRRWAPFPDAAEVTTAIAILMVCYCGFRLLRLKHEIRNLN
jgi:hypothetical protein